MPAVAPSPPVPSLSLQVEPAADQAAESARLTWEAQATAAIVELVGAIESSRDQKAACFALARGLKRLLDCEKVVVGLRQPSGRVVTCAVSDVAHFDRRGEMARLHEAALNETLVRDDIAVWPAESGDRHATIAHRKLAEACPTEFIASTPLATLDGEVVAVLTIAGGSGGRSRTETLRFFEASSRYLGNALRLVRRAQGGWLARLLRWLLQERRRRLKILTAVCVAVAALMALPVPHKMTCNCALQPLARRYAVAPYNGVLEKSLVRPGDVVTENQLLARMDDREIRWELSGLIADRDRAAKQRDTSLSRREIPDAQMAQLEIERLELKIQLLRHRQDSLEIRTAIDGVVLDGDLEDAEGAPVEIGQPLFEVAPLDRLRLEIDVPEEDLPYVRQGLVVTVTLEGSPHEAVTGEIVRIGPRAELRDEENVFVAEVLVENDRRGLRPGMQGRAKIIGRQRPLGWVLFHRTWETAIGSLR